MKARDDLMTIYSATGGIIDDATLARHLAGIGYKQKATKLFQLALKAMRTNDYAGAMEALKKEKGSK